MEIEIFKLEYLKFIFTNFYIYVGFLIILLIVTNTIRKVFSPVRDYYLKVRQKIKDYDRKEKVWEKVKDAIPPIVKKS